MQVNTLNNGLQAVLQKVVLLCLIASGPVFVSGQTAPGIDVGKNVHVTASRPGLAFSEGLLVADPANASRLLACTMFVDPAMSKFGVATFASADGGKSWKHTFQTDFTEDAMDPACAFGPDGVAYHLVAPRNPKPPDKHNRMYLLASTDGGFTWERRGSMRFLDRQVLAVDYTGGPHRGRVYALGSRRISMMHGERRMAVFLHRSLDGGRTWLGPITISPVDGDAHIASSFAVVLTDGTLVSVVRELPSDPDPYPYAEGVGEQGRLYALRSFDGGESLARPTLIADWVAPFSRAADQLSHIPSVAADLGPGPLQDRLYAAWTDQRNRGVDIMFAYSGDRGATWSRPLRVNDDRPRPASAKRPLHLHPMVAVNHRGVVGVAWYDRRDARNGLDWHVRFRASLDGGDTFLPSVVASEYGRRFTSAERWVTYGWAEGGGMPHGAPGGLLRGRVFGAFFHWLGGHFTNMTVDAAGQFWPYWIDSRTGMHQVWTAPIRIEGGVALHGDAGLATQDDVTSHVWLRIDESHYDLATGREVMKARLTNTSETAITGPLTLRLLTLESEVGIPVTLNADNGRSGPGATWNVSKYLGDGVLGPGESSATFVLEFRVTDLLPFKQGREFKSGLVRFDMRALGSLQRSETTEEKP